MLFRYNVISRVLASICFSWDTFYNYMQQAYKAIISDRTNLSIIIITTIIMMGLKWHINYFLKYIRIEHRFGLFLKLYLIFDDLHEF